MITKMKDYNGFVGILTITLLQTVSAQSPAVNIKQCANGQTDQAATSASCSMEVPSNQPHLQLDCAVTGCTESVSVYWMRGVEEMEVVPGSRQEVGPHEDGALEVTLTITEEVISITTSEVYTCVVNGTTTSDTTQVTSSISITIVTVDVRPDDHIDAHGFYLAFLILAFIVLIVASVCIGYRCKGSEEGGYATNKVYDKKSKGESSKLIMQFYS